MTDRDAWLERAMQRHETELLRLAPVYSQSGIHLEEAIVLKAR